MNNTSSTYTNWQIRFVFMAMAAALSFAWATNVTHADTKPMTQLSIASSGQVIVKDATVAGISGDTITVTSVWAGLSISWTVNTTGSTRFQPNATSTAALRAIKVGDTITFSGDLDTTASRPTVIATMVKDTSIVRDAVTEQGSVISMDPENQAFVIAASSGTTTVRVNSGTIMTLDGNYAELNQLQVGMDIEVIGSLNTTTSTVIAQRVSWKTSSESVSSAHVSMISGFFNWLIGSRGALSLKSK